VSAHAAPLGAAVGAAPAGATRTTAWRGWAVTAAGTLAAFLTIGLIAGAVEPAPSGPASSSYATTPAGVAAWAELLQRSGHPVSRLRRDLGQAALDPGATLVVLGVGSLARSAGRKLADYVRAGGHLVVGATSPGLGLGALIPGPPRWTGPSPRLFDALASVAETSGVTTVRTAGDGVWSGGPGPRVLGDRSGGALLLVRTLGHGQIDLLADPSPVQNRLLASADNAELALDLAGAPGRPVVFAEALHGFGDATGLAALPGTFWLVFAGLSLAGGTWALARGRRVGPPEPPAEIGQPPRSAYVDAMAGALTRARDPAGLTRVVRAHIGAELTRRLAQRAGSTDRPRRETLTALGLSEREADLVLAPASSGDGAGELLVLGRVLARLRSER
jgi:hypothetical protein